MTQWTKLLFALAAALVLVGLILVYKIYSFDVENCVNQPIAEQYALDGEHRAVVFERHCGADRYSVQVSILRADQLYSDSAGNILIIDGQAIDVAPQLRWKNNAELWIFHRLTGKEFRAETIWRGDSEITVKYVVEQNEV